ncbi:MAG: hypothetical protein ACYSVY_11270 [Planctomycetota bacterium]|jgi:cysteine-rich repeat protein
MSNIRPFFVLVIASAVSLLAAGAFARTPDGSTPAEESVCSDAGLTGAAFGLCNAYCEAQDCGINDRPSCEQLRTNLAKHTGTRVFPCDAFCGDGEVNQDFEVCDDGNNEDCDGCSANCREEFCGDGIVCPDEECDPPGSMCDDVADCTEECVCVLPEPCEISVWPVCGGFCPPGLECGEIVPGVPLCFCVPPNG